MVVVLLVLALAGLVSAQANEDARALLQEIASSAQNTKGWLAEGLQAGDITRPGVQIHSETRFKVAYERPSKMRLESTPAKLLAVWRRCNQALLWCATV